MGALLGNLRAGARLSCGLSVDAARFRPGLNQTVVLFVLFIGLAFAAQYASVSAPRIFNRYSFGIQTVHFAAYLLAAYLVTAVKRAPASFGMLTTTMMSAFTVVLAGSLAVALILLGTAELVSAFTVPGLCWVLLAWFVTAGVRAVAVTFGTRLDQTVLLSAILLGTIAAPPYLLRAPGLWYTARAAAAAPEDRDLDVEHVFYAQRPLLDERIGALARGRPGATDLYFLGFAGYAYQDVFMKEMRSVVGLFEDRFGTRGRSIALINNAKTLESHPLANGPNLRIAIEGIAGRMDKDEDVLFLFLTSHGGRDGSLATDFWPLDLNAVDGDAIREALDAAGIRWRVIVVSACYSGALIERLKGPRTLVITASRADRTSFGCTSEADWTYFGRAFFDEALRTETSFVTAFRTARTRIGAREVAEKLPASEPQISIGAEIEAKLAEIEAGAPETP